MSPSSSPGVVDIDGDANIAGNHNVLQAAVLHGGGSIGSLTQVSGDYYQVFAAAPRPLSRYLRTDQFRSLIDDRTRRFVGRQLILDEIGRLFTDPGFPCGYIVVHGEPGIGKTSLIAQLVKQHRYVHHFNIASQGICSTRDFLANVCAQLIVRYKLDYTELPLEATKDSGFLGQVLCEAKGKAADEPVVVLVDALDEAENIGTLTGANRLYLPSSVTKGVYFVVSTRDLHDLRLSVELRKDIYIDEKDPNNRNDVLEYIRRYLVDYSDRITPRLASWGINEVVFGEVLAEKSEGNFMYLVHVLRDIRDGGLTATGLDDIRNLPRGLRDYYRRHWRAMQTQDRERFERYYEPVVCLLATAREPVSIRKLAVWAKLSPVRVTDVVHDWREFLNEDTVPSGEVLYRVYHSSFRDFLADEVGLSPYNDRIANAAMEKISGGTIRW